MKVLIVHHHLNHYGGAEVVVSKLSAYLARQGVSVSVAALSQPRGATARYFEGINIITPEHEIPYEMIAVGASDYFKLIQKVLRLRHVVQRIMDSYDVINIHNFPAPWTLFPRHKPCVFMCNEPPDLWHNPNPSLMAKLGRRFAMGVDRFLVRQSVDIACVADEFNAERFRRRYGIEPRCIPYGIEYDFFAEGNGSPSHQYELDDNFVLLQVGQITPSKNQMASIRVLESLHNKIERIRLVLAGLGGGKYEQLLREYIHEKNLEKHVIFTGHISKEELRDLYHRCDVAIFPVHSQGSWLSPFEAASAAKPIVVSTELTCANLIRNEQIGIVTDEIDKAVLDIYRKPESYQTMAEKGREFVKANLAWDNYCQKMLSVIEEASGIS